MTPADVGAIAWCVIDGVAVLALIVSFIRKRRN